MEQLPSEAINSPVDKLEETDQYVAENPELEETAQYVAENPEVQFENKTNEILQRLRCLLNTAEEIKLPPIRNDTAAIYSKLCRALRVPENSTFVSCMNTEKMDFTYNSLGPVGIIPITKALASCTTVHDINFSYNKLGNKSIPTLTLLLDNNEHITHLNLSNNQFGKNSGKQLGLLISACRSMIVLDLSGNHLGDEELIEIGTGLVSTNNITELNLSNNEFSAASCKQFGSSLGQCGALEKIDLSRNHFEDGVMLIFKNLKNSNLKSLNLARNGIPDEAMKAVAAGLKGNKSLQLLDLSSNCISDKGAQAIAPGVKKSSTLETLLMAHNPFEGSAANPILKSAGSNLKLLDFTGIKINLSFFKTLKKCKEGNSDLKVIYGSEIRRNCFPRVPPEDGVVITESNALSVAQKLADDKGMSLRKALRSLHANFLNQEAPEEEETEEEKKKVEVRVMTTKDFTKGLVESQLEVPKAVAQELASALSVDDKVDIWNLIGRVPWRPDDLITKVKREKKPPPKEKKKGKKK